jgi:HemY protein
MAQRLAQEANRIAPGEPLTLLLAAQASQLSGDGAGAARSFQAMAEREDTKLLGLHGLFIEAQRRGDAAAARLYAEEAARKAPVPAWAGQAVFAACCAAGDWTGALERLQRNMKSRLVDPDTYRRQRAVLLTARAIAAEQNDRDRAKAFVLEAARLAPTLVPAAALAGRMLGEAGELRKASRITETAWKANPHPDLADTHAHLRPGDSARDRLARVQALAELAPANSESALAVARAALDAHEFDIARRALAPLLAAPTQRVAMLMAEVEEREHGDEGRAREWMARAVHARRDPAWTADGIVSDRWLPVSPVTGRLDAFEWKDPLAEFAGGGALIDHQRRRPSEAGGELPQASLPPQHDHSSEVEPAERAPTALPPLLDAPRNASTSASPPGTEQVLPLAHLPDDPGPGPLLPPEPQPKGFPNRQTNGWSALRDLFKR